MVKAIEHRASYPATVLTVLVVLSLSAILGFFGICDAARLDALADKAAVVGGDAVWNWIMERRLIGCSVAALFAGLMAGGIWLSRSAYERTCHAAGARVIGLLSAADQQQSGALGRSVWSTLLVLVIARLPTIPWSHFVRDDFEILTANRTNSLAYNIGLRHGDHAYPLYRLEVWACDGVFGTWAPGWNIVLLLTYAGTMWLAAKSARALGAAAVPTAIALAFFGFSLTMGLLHAGYYVLSTTIQIAAAAFAAFLAYARAERTGQTSWIVFGMTALMAGCLIDISGVWILGAVPLLLLAAGNDQWSLGGILRWVSSHRLWIWTWVFAACVAGGIHGAIYVSSRSAFLSMSDYFATPLTLLGAVQQIFYLIASGTVLQLVCPLAAYLSWPVHAASFMAAAIAVIVAVWSGTVKERAAIVAVLIIMITFAAEVAIGRPQGNHVFFPQYVATLNVLTVPLLAIVLTTISRCSFWQPGGQLCGVGFVFAVLSMTAVAFASWLPAYGAYIYGLRANQTLRRDIETLSAEITSLFQAGGDGVRGFPALDGRHFQAVMPRWPKRAGLAPYNLSHYRHFMNPMLRTIPLVRNAEMDAWVARDVDTVRSVRDSCGPGARMTAVMTPTLRDLLTAPIDLRLGSLGSSPPIASLLSDARVVVSDGSSTVPIASESFDPEVFSSVLLDLSVPDGPGDCRLVLRAAMVDGSHIDAGVTVSKGLPMPCRVNLLEFPYLALQPSLNSVSLVLVRPGSYTVRRLSLMPRSTSGAASKH
jgi:hypothetical protein